jgi:hypothetical protein
MDHRPPRRQPLTEIAGHDALNLLVDLRHPFLRTHAEEYSGCDTQAQSWNESHAQCRANDIRNFCSLVDIAANNHNIAVWQSSRDAANDPFVPTGPVRERRFLRRAVNFQVERQVSQIASNRLSARRKQGGILHHSWVLSQEICNRVQPPLRRRGSKFNDAHCDDLVRSGNQISVCPPVYDCKQDSDVHSKHAGNCCRRAERRRTDEIREHGG